jgi:hypothetical protein
MRWESRSVFCLVVRDRTMGAAIATKQGSWYGTERCSSCGRRARGSRCSRRRCPTRPGSMKFLGRRVDVPSFAMHRTGARVAPFGQAQGECSGFSAVGRRPVATQRHVSEPQRFHSGWRLPGSGIALSNETPRFWGSRAEATTVRESGAHFDDYPSLRQASGGVVRGNRPGWRISARMRTPVTIRGPGRLK